MAEKLILDALIPREDFDVEEKLAKKKLYRR